MRNLAAMCLAGLLGLSPQSHLQADEAPPVLVIHGGAGTLSRDEMTIESETAFRAGPSRPGSGG